MIFYWLHTLFIVLELILIAVPVPVDNGVPFIRIVPVQFRSPLTSNIHEGVEVPMPIFLFCKNLIFSAPPNEIYNGDAEHSNAHVFGFVTFDEL
jgi:hypothetical protein